MVCLGYGFMMPGEFADGEHPEELEDDGEDVTLPMVAPRIARRSLTPPPPSRRRDPPSRRASGLSAS